MPLGPPPLINNPSYANLENLGIAMFVLVCILAITQYARGFVANISVLIGIVIGGIVALLSGKMNHNLHPLLESGILLTAISAVVLNLYFNGARGSTDEAIEAAKHAEA